jgi:hypothetical protein
MLKYSQGIYEVKNPKKYIGKRRPRYRSSWELTFMEFCDNNPNIKLWASETIQISYFNPVSNKKTKYVPDFFVVYQDKSGAEKAELIEIKPSKETNLQKAGRSTRNQIMAVVNQAKWQAAESWCKNQGITFRVLTEHEIFHNGKAKR